MAKTYADPAVYNERVNVNDLDRLLLANSDNNATEYATIGSILSKAATANDIVKMQADSHHLTDQYNYSADVIEGASILSTGVLESYAGRGSLFFRLSKDGTADKIYGCTILTYQWYSSVLDLDSGSDSLGRTTSNNPPEGAKYCGLTIDTTLDYSNILIQKTGEYKSRADNHFLLNEYNYSADVVEGASIPITGVLESYADRGVLFFRLSKDGTADEISGCTILAYQWYSSVLDLGSGSDSLGRTTSNNPPEGAKYCGLTIDTTLDYSNILIQKTGEIADNLSVLGSTLNNSVGENCFANNLRTDLKILGFGNSFMRNSVHYLSKIASSGITVNLKIGNLYTGGTQLHQHLAALNDKTTPYVWNKYENGVNTETLNNQTGEYGLLNERWDAIILHQYTPWDYPFMPTLGLLIEKIISILGYCPKFYLNATWAGSLDNNVTYYGYATEIEMWEAVMDYNKEASRNSGVVNIIPTGTAVQNARTLSFANDYNRFVNAQGDWHHLNPAGGFIAACTIYEKIVRPLNGVSCDQTSFRILAETSLAPSSIIDSGILVTDTNYQVLCNSAIEAVKNPAVVTTITG
jgi:hypothetical protein